MLKNAKFALKQRNQDNLSHQCNRLKSRTDLDSQ